MYNSENYVSEALKYVSLHYHEPITLKMISSQLYLNPAYLGRIFAQKTGMSFSDYLCAYRLEIALELLQKKQIPVQDIAVRVGFSSSNYFYRVFKHKIGVTPLSFRKDPYLMPNHLLKPVLSSGGNSQTGKVVLTLESDNDGESIEGGVLLASPLNDMTEFYYLRQTWSESIIECIDSVDQGEHWEKPKILFRESKAHQLSTMNVVAFSDAGRTIFYTVLKNGYRWLLRRDSPDGIRYGEPRNCYPLPENYAAHHGAMLCTKETHPRKLILPFEQCLPSGRSILRFCISRDDGTSWHISQSNISMNNRYAHTGISSPMLVEYGDGCIHGLGSTMLGRPYEFDSRNGGETWGAPQPSYLTSDDQPICVCKVRDNAYLAVFNPISGYISRDEQGDPGSRSRLVYSVSRDCCVTWEHTVVLEDGSGDPTSPREYDSPMACVGENVIIGYRLVHDSKTHKSGTWILRKLDPHVL